MVQRLIRTGFSRVAIATSLLVMACASEPVSESPSPATSSTEQPAPEQPAAEATATEKTGTFVPAEVLTAGTVKLVMKDDQAVLEFDAAFKTSDQGPDLVVVLHKSADVVGESKPPAYPLNEGDYVFVADLEAFNGAQTYPIPEEIDVSQYQSVAIWCRKFNATFGVATLQ